MPLYEVGDDKLTELPVGTFADLRMYERDDIQRLLRNDIRPLGEDLLVISEEFGGWEDARRRIDLLALDTAGRLVVIELKRTEAGGHMELQALRYAAMVSSMTFDEVVDTYSAFLTKHRPGQEVDARTEILEFLADDDSVDEEEAAISTQVRINLVSANFGRELTTAVLWLNSYEGMDIRCFRLIPYAIDERVVLDVQQVIPLPEATDYQIKVRQKVAERERARTKSTDGRDLTKYQIVVDGQPLTPEPKRQAVRTMVEQLSKKGVPLPAVHELMPKRGLKVLPGLHVDEASVRQAMKALGFSEDQINRRHFTDSPLLDVDNEETYIVYMMWGLNTEPTLRSLAEGFPEAGVTFRAFTDATEAL